MHDFEAELHLAHEDGEPRSFVEAKGDVACHAEMQQEMDVVEQNRTWELADLPAGHRAITLKWIYKLPDERLRPYNSGISLRQTAYAKRMSS
jgi:hypothetical protein